MSKKKVAELVQERLREYHPGGADLSVVDEEIYLRDDCWHVTVRPSAEPRNTFEYYEALADVEDALREKAHLNVWLVPALPDQALQDTPSGADLPGVARGAEQATRCLHGSSMSKEQVAHLVRERLREFRPGGVTLSVVDDKIWKENDCWRVPIRPSKEPPRESEYSYVLAEVESQLAEQEDLNVWLMPTDSEEELQKRKTKV
jgi:hypothetical protein